MKGIHGAGDSAQFEVHLTVSAPRILLGGISLIGALDGFAFILAGDHLIHLPTWVEGLAFEVALKEAGFLWPLMKSVELIGALVLLSNGAPAPGVAMLVPIVMVIVLFHAVRNTGGLPLAAVLDLTGGLTFWHNRSRYAELLRSNTNGSVPKVVEPTTY